ncbi:Flagellar hook-length control protein-like protein [Burkholderia multivorans]
MTGIDSVAAATLASRIDSLLTDIALPAMGGATAAQVGTPAAGASPSSAQAAGLPAPPQASAQTALSEVGLVLDAISRFGGDATPAVMGSAPLLADPAALLRAAASQTAADATGSTVPQDASSTAAQAAQHAQATQAAQSSGPVAALRAALAQAVNDSGLFYESHLAQWLAGQRPVAALEREPQARLPIPSATPAGTGAGDVPDPSLEDILSARVPLPTGATRDAAAPQPGAPSHAFLTPDASTPPRFAALAGDARAAEADLQGGPGAHARAALADASADTTQATPAALHPATMPLVRQQLDLLATDQFRWIGEAWPGARLDWTIEPDGSGGHAARAADMEDGIAWRTRLTLTLPSLGTVDADLVLNGTQLVARLGANEAGAERLTRHESDLRARLLASGLQLGGLSIRAVDGAPDSFDAAAARTAAAAYARAADGPAAHPLTAAASGADGSTHADDWMLR